MIGPIGGIVLTGMIFDKLGGYTGERALPVCTMALVIAFVCCFFSVLVDTAGMVAFLVTTELFCGAFCLPVMSGVMIT